MRIKKLDNVSNGLKTRIQQTYRKYLPENVTLDFEEVDGFEKTITGKFKFVYRKFIE